MHSGIKKIGLILLIVGAGLYVVFFSAGDFQNDPDHFVDRKEASIKSSVIPLEKKFYDEYHAGLYQYKAGRFTEARAHFYNVYYKYPSIPKGQLQLDAQFYMILCDKRIAEAKEQLIPDTETLVKKYYETR